MSINERQRMQYLEAFGVESYMPRFLLPTAPPIRRCAEVPAIVPGNSRGDAEAIAPKPAVSSPVAVAKEQVEQKPAPISPSVTNLEPVAEPEISLSATPVAREVGTIVSHASASGHVAETVTFCLRVWRLADLLVADSHDVKQALPVETLLNNVLFALGYRGLSLPRAEVFQWPLIRNRYADNSAQAARSAVSAMLNAVLDEGESTKLLLLGNAACTYGLPQKLWESPQSSSYEKCIGHCHTETGLAIAVTPSLADMLLQPDQKAVAWEALKHLRIVQGE